MMRPVVGKPIPLGTGDSRIPIAAAVVYPNPSNGGTVRINVPGSGPLAPNSSAVVTDLYGRQVLVSDPSVPVEVRALAPGLYILTVFDHGGVPVARGKFIVTH